MLLIILAIVLGIIAGTITGLIPGIHINLVALLLFFSSAFLLQYTTPLILVTFIISMAITHTFIDFIPSVFLGAPNEDTALSILPGHRYLLKGKGYGAVKLTLIGSFFGLLIALAISPAFIVASPLFYPYLYKAIPFLLIFISGFLILKEKQKIWALVIFMLSGILGFASLNFVLVKQPLFPLFTGLFGSSLLTVSFLQKVKVPKQKIKDIPIKKKEIKDALGLSILSGSLVSFLPGVGSATAAVISSGIKKLTEKSFLVLVGAINTIVMFLSFVALYSINKPRTGIAVFVGKFLPALTMNQLWIFLIVGLIAGCIALFVALFWARFFSKKVMKTDYKKLSLLILIFLVAITPIISGWAGLFILLIGTAIGIATSIIGVKKIFMMGSLLIPVIIWNIV
ncbi:MAG: tripartite tricarboxylate transporter permease [archaeon]|nr:MAG: tripartite tricarboxylate transporter permease [archaeon]